MASLETFSRFYPLIYLLWWSAPLDAPAISGYQGFSRELLKYIQAGCIFVWFCGISQKVHALVVLSFADVQVVCSRPILHEFFRANFAFVGGSQVLPFALISTATKNDASERGDCTLAIFPCLRAKPSSNSSARSRTAGSRRYRFLWSFFLGFQITPFFQSDRRFYTPFVHGPVTTVYCSISHC